MGRGRRSISIMVKGVESPKKRMGGNQSQGLCYLTNRKGYQDNGICPRHELFRIGSRREAVSLIGDKPFVQLEATRGCFNTCAFCVSGGEKPVRTIPLEAIRPNVWIIFISMVVKNVRVLDRTFNYNNKEPKTS